MIPGEGLSISMLFSVPRSGNEKVRPVVGSVRVSNTPNVIAADVPPPGAGFIAAIV